MNFLKKIGWKDEGICWYGGNGTSSITLESEKIKKDLMNNKSGGQWVYMGAISPNNPDRVIFQSMKFKTNGMVEIILFKPHISNHNIGNYPYEVTFESQGKAGPIFSLIIRNVSYRGQTKDLVYRATLVKGKDLDSSQIIEYSSLRGTSIDNDSFPISSMSWELVS